MTVDTLLVLQVVPTLPNPAHPGPAQLEQHRVDGQLTQLISNDSHQFVREDRRVKLRANNQEFIEYGRLKGIHAFVSTFECWIELCWI